MNNETTDNNETKGRGATTALRQLQWSQILSDKGQFYSSDDWQTIICRSAVIRVICSLNIFYTANLRSVSSTDLQCSPILLPREERFPLVTQHKNFQ